jgi:AcrR family transcriptional regulator
MSVRTPASPAQARLQKTRERVRREILLAAAGVFARHGYAAATLTDLAEAAGYAPPSLYRYFRSKEEIFSSLVELLKLELHGTFDLPVDRGLPLAARVEALLRAQIEMVRARRDIFTMLMATRPLSQPGKAPLPDLRAGRAFYEASMTAWLRRHVARRELRCSFELAARALTGISQAFHSCHADGADQAPAAEEARQVVDLALHGFQATGPSSPPAIAPRSP